MYEGLLPQFRDTPSFGGGFLSALGYLFGGVGRRVNTTLHHAARENWFYESLQENGTTVTLLKQGIVRLHWSVP